MQSGRLLRVSELKIMNNNKVILVHGWEGSSDQDWRPWLKYKLERHGYEVVVPQMPDSMHPAMMSWVKKLAESVGETDQDVYFVGHSLGCIAILRFLENVRPDLSIRGSILVAGFGEDLHYDGYEGELSSFFSTTLDWDRIKARCLKFVSVHSSNDKWVDISNSELFEKRLGAKKIIMDNMGHFSGSDGLIEVPFIYDELLTLMTECS